MTSFHSRKLVFPFLCSSDGSTMRNRTSPIASPLPSPVSFPCFSPPLREGHHDHLHFQPTIIIVISGLSCVILFIIFLSKILRYYYFNRYNISRRNPPILFDIRGDSPFFDDEEHEQVMRQHPLWFSPTEGLQQSTIDSITVYRYRNDEVLVKETECLVCLGEFQQEESLRLLPKCSHAFHVPCIDTWLRSHKTCPLCRAPIVHDTASVDGGTESDSSVSDMIEDMEECSSGVVRVGDEDSSEEGRGDGIEVLSEWGEVSDHSSILFSFASDVGTQPQEFDHENEPKMKRSFSVDSSSAMEKKASNSGAKMMLVSLRS